MEDDPRAALFDAIRKGDVARVERALAGDPGLAQACDAAGVKALLVAKYHRHAPVEALLVEALASAPLDAFEATSIGRLDRLRVLLDADPTVAAAVSADGFTALHFAAFFQQLACAQLLLERGAGVNVPSANPMQVYPLHSAAAARDLALVELLLRHGADPNTRQQMGYTALCAAAQQGDVAMVRTLLNHGANPALVTDDGKSPLSFARASGDSATEALLA